MADLNVKSKAAKDKEGAAVVRRAFELGFSSIAWNHTIFGKPTQANITSIARISHAVPHEDRGSVSLRKLAVAEGGNSVFRQLQRLTIVVDEASDTQVLNSSNDLLRDFDIIAAVPCNARVFSLLCKDSDVDIISLDFSKPLGFAIAKKTVDEAVKRGIYFEIKCTPLVLNSAMRRETFCGTRQLIRVLRGRNILLTSGAENASQLRSPQDIANLGQALSMTAPCSEEAVQRAYRAIEVRASSRKRRHLPVTLCSYDALREVVEQERKARRDILLSGRKRRREYDSDDDSQQSQEDVAATEEDPGRPHDEPPLAMFD